MAPCDPIPSDGTERTGCIYALCDPTEYGAPVRYVGLTTVDVRDRLSSHVSAARAGKSSYAYNWIRGVLSSGSKPMIVILQDVPEPFLADLERYWIAEGRSRGWKLTNVTSGGEFHEVPDETRRKISASSRGRKMSPEAVERMIVAWRSRVITQEEHERRSASQRGHVVTQVTREKLRQAKLLQAPMSEEARAKLSKAGMWRKPSAETLRKLREAWTRRGPISPETREKMNAAKRGKKRGPRSAETREKIRAALLGHPVSAETLAKMMETRRSHAAEARNSDSDLGQQLGIAVDG